MTLKEQWKWRLMRRLYTEITVGCCSINSQEDASYTAAILRLLADELDPDRKGDPRAPEFVRIVKNDIGHDDDLNR